MQRQFLASRLQEAVDNNDIKRINEVKAIIRGENQRRCWNSIKKGVGQKRTPAPTTADTIGKVGNKVECTTKETVEEAIHGKINPRFSRAKSAPMCNGPLFELLGYNADTKAGAQILEGTCVPPPGTDPATGIILQEIARMWRLMGEGEVNIIITKEGFKHYWGRTKEKTASSYPGRHFGHYKAAAHSEYLSEVHARTLSLITKTRATPGRWSRGLSVMLEKITGVALVTKLRAVLLIEADFNCHNRLIFGG